MFQKTPVIIKLSNFLRVSRLLIAVLGASLGFIALANGVPKEFSLIISVVCAILGMLLSIGIFFIALSVPLTYLLVETYSLSDLTAGWTLGIWLTAFLLIWLIFSRWVFVRADIVKKQLNLDDSFKLQDTPVITAPSDIIRGVSGVDKFARCLEREPSNPKHWFLLGNAMAKNSSLSVGYRLAKAPLAPISTIVSFGIQQAINYKEGSIDKLTPEKCYLLSITLAKNEIHQNGPSPETLLILGRNYDVLSTISKDDECELKFTRLAIQYLSTAADRSNDKRFKAEAFFYLAEIYQKLGEDELMLRFANLSRKLGFIPAIVLIHDYLNAQGVDMSDEDYSTLVEELINKGFIDFQYDYRPTMTKRLKDSFVSLVKGQGARIYKSLISLDKAINN